MARFVFIAVLAASSFGNHAAAQTNKPSPILGDPNISQPMVTPDARSVIAKGRNPEQVATFYFYPAAPHLGNAFFTTYETIVITTNPPQYVRGWRSSYSEIRYVKEDPTGNYRVYYGGGRLWYIPKSNWNGAWVWTQSDQGLSAYAPAMFVESSQYVYAAPQVYPSPQSR